MESDMFDMSDTAVTYYAAFISKRATRPVTHFVSAQPAATGQRVRVFPGSRGWTRDLVAAQGHVSSSSGTTKYIQTHLHTALSYGKVEWANLEGHLKALLLIVLTQWGILE